MRLSTIDLHPDGRHIVLRSFRHPMSLKVFPVIAAGVTALMVAVVTRAQDPLPTVLRAGVDVVHVDVSVLDKNRRFVGARRLAGLTRGGRVGATGSRSAIGRKAMAMMAHAGNSPRPTE